ncbi:hypothetical protein GCM10027578_36650 [Spirosoma luteolum]
MKSVAVAVVACCLSVSAFAQNQQGGAASVLDQAQMDAVKKEKEKSDKDITDAKASVKASTWMDRGKTYQQIASQYIRMDSAAATTAFDAYKKVIELDKDKKGGPGRLAKEAEEALKSQQLYYAFMQQGVAKFQGKNYADAVKSLRVASDINPKDTTAPLYAAIGAQQVRDNNTAKELLERYVANGGKDAQVYGSLVQLYRTDKEIDKALAVLDKGMALDPNNKDLSNEKINIMLTSGRMDEAVAGLKKMAEKEPNNPQNLVMLGQIYDNNANKLDDDARKLEGESKKGSSTGKKLADAKELLTTYNGEVTRLSAAIKKQPKNADLKRQLADVQKRATDQKATIAQLEAVAKEAAANSGASADAEKQLVDIRKKLTEERAMSKEYYLKALALDGANYDANYNLGVTYFNEAVNMKKAVDGMDMAEYNKRGKEVDGQVCGKFKQALPYFQKAKSVKDEPEVTENLTNLQNILKQYEERKIVCVEPTK